MRRSAALHDQGGRRGLGLGEVRPRGEVPPGSGEDDRASLGIVPEGERRVLDLLDVKCVEAFAFSGRLNVTMATRPRPLHLEMPVFHSSRASEVYGGG